MVSESRTICAVKLLLETVLILVLLEDGIGGCHGLGQRTLVLRVLILVLLEDGIGADEIFYMHMRPVSS